MPQPEIVTFVINRVTDESLPVEDIDNGAITRDKEVCEKATGQGRRRGSSSPRGRTGARSGPGGEIILASYFCSISRGRSRRGTGPSC